MIRKLFLALMILSLCATAFGADTVTTNYRFIIPEEGSRDWNQKISNDIITIDSALKILSDDSTIISADMANRVSTDAILTSLTADAISAGVIELTASNITYLGIDDDIEAAIAAATAGDTIKLAAGTYTITDDIDITQAINVVGQGIGKTTVTCATASKNVFDVSTSTVRIAGMTITNSGGTGVGIKAYRGMTGLVFENLDVVLTGAGENAAFSLVGSTTMRNVTFSVTSDDDVAFGVYFWNMSSVTSNLIINCYNVNGTATGGGGTGFGSNPFVAFNENDANTVTMNLYNCQGTATAGAGDSDTGALSTSETTNNATINAYNCTFSGADADVIQTGTNTLTLYDTTLVNNTTSGTITYGGTVVTLGISADALSVDTIMTLKFTSSSAAAGGEVGRFAITSSDGSTCYVKIFSGS